MSPTEQGSKWTQDFRAAKAAGARFPDGWQAIAATPGKKLLCGLCRSEFTEGFGKGLEAFDNVDEVQFVKPSWEAMCVQCFYSAHPERRRALSVDLIVAGYRLVGEMSAVEASAAVADAVEIPKEWNHVSRADAKANCDGCTRRCEGAYFERVLGGIGFERACPGCIWSWYARDHFRMPSTPLGKTFVTSFYPGDPGPITAPAGG